MTKRTFALLRYSSVEYHHNIFQLRRIYTDDFLWEHTAENDILIIVFVMNLPW